MPFFRLNFIVFLSSRSKWNFVDWFCMLLTTNWNWNSSKLCFYFSLSLLSLWCVRVRVYAPTLILLFNSNVWLEITLFILYWKMEDDNENEDFRTIKMGITTICTDELLLRNINDAVIRASIIGYFATTMVRHLVYEAIIFRTPNFVMPTSERLLAPYWNEVRIIFIFI